MRKFEKFLAKELGIEFKAAIYFYTIIFFYFAYRLLHGSSQVDILVLIEMMATISVELHAPFADAAMLILSQKVVKERKFGRGLR